MGGDAGQRPPVTAGGRRLSDIADRASVSEATVSRVLNGKPGVADSTRRRVLAALDTLGVERAGRDAGHSTWHSAGRMPAGAPRPGPHGRVTRG